MAIGLHTYSDTSRKEDVLDLVMNIDYKSTPFISRIGESVASNTLHEWQVDTYADAAANLGIEGADVSVADLSGPTRKTNICQIFQKIVTVTDTEMAIPHYGINDPFAYQADKKMVEIGRDMELAAIAGTRASGSSGVARSMDGAIALISTNKTAQTSGTSFTEDVLNSLLGLSYTAGTDEEIDLILTGAYLKRVIDKMTTNVTRNIDATEFKQVQRIDVYVSSFGTHEVAMERNIPAGGVLCVDTSKWKLAWLTGRRLKITPLAKTGSATKALLEGETTLEALAEKGSVYASGYFRG